MFSDVFLSFMGCSLVDPYNHFISMYQLHLKSSLTLQIVLWLLNTFKYKSVNAES